MENTRLSKPNEFEAQRHMAPLDGLRAVAIGFVMLKHFSDPPPTSALGLAIGAVAYAGSIGVDLFFVISGFLITGLCLDHRGPGFLRAFYGRRALRILPPYFALILVLLIACRGLLPGAAWLSTFTTNILVARSNSWQVLAPGTTHLWSLAVEEQYYLVWPLLVTLMPTRVALATAVGSLPIAFVVRWFSTPLAAAVLTTGRMDALAAGAIVAFLIRAPQPWPDAARTALARVSRLSVAHWALLGIGGCLGVTLVSARLGEHVATTYLLSALPLVFGIFLAAIVFADSAAPIARVLSGRMIAYVGRRSYAMYLVHLPINVALRAAGVAPTTGTQLLLYLIVVSALTIGVAEISWRLVERPMLSLKRYFLYGHLSPELVRSGTG